MTGTEQSQNVPQLRFPEFEDNWNPNKLGSIATFSKGKGISKSEIDKDGVTECIRYGELYTVYSEVINEITSKTNLDINTLILSDEGDVIIPASGETQIDIATASCVAKSGVALGGDLNIIKSEIDGIFLSYYLNNARKKNIARLAQGISVVHLYASQLASLTVNTPPPPEQTKIATFLTAVDKRINLLQKKKAELELYKKGLMQKLFSQTIRFKPARSAGGDENGNDFADWEEKKLGEISEITTGKLDANARVENGEYHFYTCAKNVYKIDDFAFDFEALLISGNGANVGYVHHYNGKFNAYQRTYVLFDLMASYKYIKYFLDENLKKRIHREKKDGNTPYIVMETLVDMKIKLPSKDEQKKIANFLSSIDKSIDKMGNQIDDSVMFKQGLLQKMFV